jgi:hypothetical protein
MFAATAAAAFLGTMEKEDMVEHICGDGKHIMNRKQV